MAYISFQPKDYFNTLLWTGNSGNQSITGNDFTADLTWSKTRSHAESHVLMDTVRDAGTTLNQSISSNTANVEGTLNNSSTLTVNSTGFDLAGTSGGTLNYTGYTYATWLWRANGHTGSANTDGDINSTVSANTTSGFSIVKYTGNGSSNQTVGHGLGVAPAVIMYKGIDAVHNWLVYHQSLGATQGIVLNLAGVAVTGSGYFDNTAPTSSVFSVSTTGGNDQNNVSSEDYIAYCFAEKKGFSKFGSYTGNGNADGTFIYTGFKPAWVMVKKSSASGDNWSILDNKRNTFNVMDKYLDPNSSNAEGTADIWDFTSNGFKMRNTFSGYNASGATFIYMAFSDQSIVSSNGLPATAR